MTTVITHSNKTFTDVYQIDTQIKSIIPTFSYSISDQSQSNFKTYFSSNLTSNQQNSLSNLVYTYVEKSNNVNQRVVNISSQIVKVKNNNWTLLNCHQYPGCYMQDIQKFGFTAFCSSNSYYIRLYDLNNNNNICEFAGSNILLGNYEVIIPKKNLPIDKTVIEIHARTDGGELCIHNSFLLY